MTDTIFVQCGDDGYTIVCYPDDTVAILDAEGNVVAGWPQTAELTATEARALTKVDLCTRLGALDLLQADAR